MVNISFSIDLDPFGTVLPSLSERWVTRTEVADLALRFEEYDVYPTWFVRADNFVKQSRGAVISEIADFLSAHSDYDWGWHPHLDFSQNEVAQLIQIFELICAQGIRPPLIRVGEGRGSNEITCFVASSSIKVDCSAIPGRFRNDSQRSFDWRDSPNDVFWQNRQNYQMPQSPIDGEVIQVPMTTARAKASYDDSPKLRYLDLCYKNDVFRKGFVEAVNQDLNHIHIVTHPETVLFDDIDNGLYKSGWDNLGTNLAYIKKFSELNPSIGIKFSTITNVAADFFRRTREKLI